MKMYPIILCITACAIFITGCSTDGPHLNTGFMRTANTLEEALAETETIAVVEATGNKEETTRDGVDILLTEWDVQSVIRGDPKLEKTKIRLFEIAAMSRMSRMESDKEKVRCLLFLHPQNSSLGDDVYSVLNVYQGFFKVVKNKLVYDGHKEDGQISSWQAELEGLSIEQAEKKLRLVR